MNELKYDYGFCAATSEDGTHFYDHIKNEWVPANLDIISSLEYRTLIRAGASFAKPINTGSPTPIRPEVPAWIHAELQALIEAVKDWRHCDTGDRDAALTDAWDDYDNVEKGRGYYPDNDPKTTRATAMTPAHIELIIAACDLGAMLPATKVWTPSETRLMNAVRALTALEGGAEN